MVNLFLFNVGLARFFVGAAVGKCVVELAWSAVLLGVGLARFSVSWSCVVGVPCWASQFLCF